MFILRFKLGPGEATGPLEGIPEMMKRRVQLWARAKSPRRIGETQTQLHVAPTSRTERGSLARFSIGKIRYTIRGALGRLQLPLVLAGAFANLPRARPLGIVGNRQRCQNVILRVRQTMGIIDFEILEQPRSSFA